MNELTNFILPEDLRFIKPDEKLWLNDVFHKYKGFPNLENLWKIMDEIWDEYNCDPFNYDSRIEDFYSHPVWLLNGLFIEQDPESIKNKKVFTDWVCSKKQKKIADYGGGFGTLGRMIAKSCPDAEVVIIEPHPHQLAIERIKNIPNLSYKKKLEGNHDILIATDVFEHVLDPLALVAETSGYLNQNGHYLIANCFEPVIKCHLPQYYHFFHTFSKALHAMNFVISEKVIYGTVFKINKELSLDDARKVEKKSQKLWYFTKNLHPRIAGLLTKFLI